MQALAGNGEPRYPAGFAHTDYVNPDAPKGGTLIESRIGSFDNLNPFILTAKVPDERLHLLFDTLMTAGLERALRALCPGGGKRHRTGRQFLDRICA